MSGSQRINMNHLRKQSALPSCKSRGTPAESHQHTPAVDLTSEDALQHQRYSGKCLPISSQQYGLKAPRRSMHLQWRKHLYQHPAKHVQTGSQSTRSYKCLSVLVSFAAADPRICILYTWLRRSILTPSIKFI